MRHTTCLFLAAAAVTILIGSPGVLAQPGPVYYADVQLIDTRPAPDDVLPPGPVVGTKSRVKVDSGSPRTFCNRAHATNQGLLTPAGANNPGLTNPNDPATARDESMGRFRGAGGRVFTTWKSIGLSVNAGGLGRSTVRFKNLPGKMVFFPKGGGPPRNSLLGTDFFAMMGAMSVGFRPDGSVTFFASVCGATPGKRVGLILDPDPDPLVAGFYVSVGDVSVTGPLGDIFSPFALVTGSPFTVLSQSLADQIGLVAETEYFLDDETQSVLFVDGFILEETISLGLATLDHLKIPTLSGDTVTAHGLKVLINPDSPDSLLGTDIFFAEGHKEVRLSFDQEQLVFTHEVTPDIDPDDEMPFDPEWPDDKEAQR